MKGSKQHKRYMAILRRSAAKRSGKKNGVVPGSWMDDLLLFKMDRCKKWNKQRTKVNIDE
jgi:hypothetical protein